MTLWRSWKPSARVPRTASVRLTLARREAHDRRQAAVGVGGHARARRGCVPERLRERDPVPDRDRLRAAVAVDAARLERGVHALAIDRQLAGQHVVEHLAPLAEPGLDDAPQVGLCGRVEAVVEQS